MMRTKGLTGPLLAHHATIGGLSKSVGNRSFSPASLFLDGSQGAWYDPSIMSTMWQDSAGTTPVTAAGQPVGKILDLSGRGNHAIQATAINRPTLQQDANGYWYLAFNGTNSYLAAPSQNYNGVAGVGFSYVGGYANLAAANTAFGFRAEGQADFLRFGVNQVAFVYYTPSGNSPGATGLGSVVNGTVYVGSSRASSALQQVQAWTNLTTGGSQSAPTAFMQTAGALTIGCLGGASFFYTGNLYASMLVAKPLSDQDLAIARTYFGARCGVVI